jgi:hypothetical protein
MANEVLVTKVKSILALARTNQMDEAYAAYRELFSNPDFTSFRPEDQRQALRLMLLAKRVKATPAVVEAHRAALVPLTELVSAHGDAGDHELLGVCHVVLGNEDSARAIFRTGLAIERERDGASDLCGSLLTRISAL